MQNRAAHSDVTGRFAARAIEELERACHHLPDVASLAKRGSGVEQIAREYLEWRRITKRPDEGDSSSVFIPITLNLACLGSFHPCAQEIFLASIDAMFRPITRVGYR